MKNNTLTLLITFLFLSCFITQARDLKLVHFNTGNGLSQNTISDITQDKSGFLWFATEYGLSRFDGYNFKIYRETLDDKLSIAGNWINALAVDSSNNVWVGTEMGLCKYDRYTDQFITYKIDNDNNALNYIIDIQADKKGTIWVLAPDNGLLKFNPANEKFEVVAFYPDSLKERLKNNMWKLFIDSSEKIWIGTNLGAIVYGINEKYYKQYSYDKKDSQSLSFYEVTTFYEDNGKMWVGTSVGLSVIDIPTEKVIRVPGRANELEKVWVTDIVKSEKGAIWITTLRSGLFLLINDQKLVHNFTYDVNKLDGLAENNLLTLFKDMNGVIWIGSGSTGVSKFETRGQYFNSIKNKPGVKNSLSSNDVFSLLMDSKGNIWAGTRGWGADKFLPDQSAFTNYNYAKNSKTSLISNTIWDIVEDNNRDIWFASDYGIARYNSNQNNFFWIQRSEDSTTLVSDAVICLETDNLGNLWIGTFHGLSKYNTVTKTFENFNYDSTNSNSISSNEIYNLLYHDNTLFIGTFNGVDVYDYKTRRITHLFQGVNEKLRRVTALYLDSDDILWIGTDYYLYAFSKRTNKLKRYSVEEGLSDNLVVSIIEDNKRNLWFATNNGLTRWIREENKFNIFKKHDGLADNEFNPGVFKNTNGDLYFSNIGGVVYFSPDKIRVDESVRKPIISEMIVYTNQDLSVSGNLGKFMENKFLMREPTEVNLNYSQSTFTIEFVSLSFNAPELNQYEYMMEGLDDDWVKSGARNIVTYNKMPPGEYRFMVRASDSHGVWSRDVGSVKILIRPPFWDTGLFRFSAAIFLLLLVYGFYKWRMRLVEKRASELEAIVRERTKELSELNATKDKFFSIISHDLLNPFSSLLGSSELLLNDYKHLKEEDVQTLIKDISNSSKNTYELLENLLQWSRSQQGMIDVKPVKLNIRDIVEKICLILEPVAAKKEIKLINRLEPDIAVLADQNIIITVLSNLITNAIKFSHMGSEVAVSAKQMSDHIIMTVSDKGVGMTQEDITELFRIDKHRTKKGTSNEKGTGLGLILCKEFVEKSGGKIWVNSKEGIGSDFCFTLPLPV